MIHQPSPIDISAETRSVVSLRNQTCSIGSLIISRSIPLTAPLCSERARQSPSTTVKLPFSSALVHGRAQARERFHFLTSVISALNKTLVNISLYLKYYVAMDVFRFRQTDIMGGFKCNRLIVTTTFKCDQSF